MKVDLICPTCGYENQTERGWRVHMSRSHGGYKKEDLERAGIEQSAHDRIKFMSGFQSMDEVRASAPETEGEGGAGASGPKNQPRTRTPRLSKEDQEKLAQQADRKSVV